MNPANAIDRGLSDGDRVRIANELGEIAAWLGVTDEVREGVVSLPGKWWSVPTDTAAVTNLLTPPLFAPGGQPAYNDTWVEVTAVANAAVLETTS
jgi:anaerobic selenocysteine-containing dehydrogenase